MSTCILKEFNVRDCDKDLNFYERGTWFTNSKFFQIFNPDYKSNTSTSTNKKVSNLQSSVLFCSPCFRHTQVTNCETCIKNKEKKLNKHINKIQVYCTRIIHTRPIFFRIIWVPKTSRKYIHWDKTRNEIARRKKGLTGPSCGVKNRLRRQFKPS